ncbi:protein mono-ADP-ribosyltransferase PARP14 [Puntigrus tetrazona]|uniref:protein mono-ADP-ribosyltransferase PARP14 n=1 Tax=Puntigrus tetrazona TaxID=1606681 RepID=UPI001C89FC6C|nr:protein mono-ADP-ribosyltransferase PARP14 [Puntigrus tetrazona]
MHVCGERNPEVIKTLAKQIVVQCDQGCYRSVAIPAICAGQGGLDPSVVAKSILEGIKDAPGPLLATSVTTRGRSGSTRSTSHSLPLPVTLDLSSIVMSLPDTESRARASAAYEVQCSTHTFSPDEIECLTLDEKDLLRSKVNSLHLQLKEISSNRWVVKGLKEGVSEVAMLIQDALRRQVREKDQMFLFSQVTWCILGPRGNWQKLPKDMNFKLEKADVIDGIVDAQGVKWTVDLKNMKARNLTQVTTLKRLQNLSDFTVPIYWDNITETLEVIDLDQSSKEYQTVKMGFKTTVKKTVLKIQRIQNVNLRRLYEGRKTELENRNDTSVGAGEKILYHGTSEESCSLIKTSNFNRNFAGQNATLYGHGTYPL